DPEAYSLVEQHMMHGPCWKDRKASPCMEEGVCSKKFPRSYVPHTQVNDSGYILYRRRKTEQVVCKGNIKLDNQFVVPHNLQILKNYKAHVNVEWCNKSSAIKYLFKYITKGVDRCTFKASQFSSPRSLRYMFVLILVFCQVSEPQKLWDHSWQDMAEDVLMHQRRLLRFPDLQLTPNELQHYTLIEIESLLHTFEKSLTEFTGMPLPNKAILDEMKQKAMASHSQFDIAEETMIHHQLFSKLNNQQRSIYDAVIKSVYENQGKLFFLYGAGGTGKTFLYRAIIAALRSGSKKVIPVASSAIAALLLPGGRTAHSRFNIPLKLYEDTYCKVKTGTLLANFLSESDLIIWDEAPMAHRHTFEAVDRTLRNILSVSDKTALTKPFGGKT
ncbi:unnamed protein product, partial [Brassica oleracea]